MLRPWNLTINLESVNKNVPLYQALAQEVQRLIENGVLHAGDAMPSSRELAEQLRVSRKTVVTAMDKLVYSGLLERRPRVGLFVSGRTLPSSIDPMADSPAAAVGRYPSECNASASVVIDDGRPDLSLMPAAPLVRACRMHFNRLAKWKQLDYFDPRGYERLRQALSMALCHSFGVSVESDEIQITYGGQQAIYLSMHALLKPGDVVAVESLTRESLIQAIETAGLRVIKIPVDRDGMQVDKLAEALRQEPNLRAVYVTPRFNFPTTVQLSCDRRLQLAKLVTDHDLLLIEDDFDCFIHLSSAKQVLPLFCLLPKGNYLYVCTATRVLAPSVRMGFVAASKEIVDKLARYRALVDVQGNAVMERALQELIESGEMRRHIRISRDVYGQRLDYITQLIRQELQGKVLYRRPNGGLAIWLEMAEDPTPRLQSKGIDAPVIALPDGGYGMRIGYASMPKENMDLLISVLKG